MGIDFGCPETRIRIRCGKKKKKKQSVARRVSVFEEEEREEEREKKKKSSKSHLPVVAYTHARFPRSVPSHAAVCRTSGQINVSPVAENSCELGRRE